MKIQKAVNSMIERLLTSRLTLWSVALALYQIAWLRRSQPSHKSNLLRRVVHVSPYYFSKESFIGGGERYPTALAKAMANHVETVLISFGSERLSFQQGQCRVEVYPAIGFLSNPISYRFLWELVKADVVHCHQYRTIVTNLAILAGAALRKRIFVTDHGGPDYNFTERLPLFDFVDKFLTVSHFAAQILPPTERLEVIYGGIDESFIYSAMSDQREQKVVFVGRLLPHKGINDLIDAVDKDVQIDIIGRVYNEDYFSLLKERATGKQVRFLTNASDAEIRAAYQSALVTVLPSVYVDINGTKHPAPELLGLVLLESMACGTPVICTNVGGMPEVVLDGVTGFIVPPNDKASLRERIYWFLNHPDEQKSMGQQAREWAMKQFTWEKVVQRCLAAYLN